MRPAKAFSNCCVASPPARDEPSSSSRMINAFSASPIASPTWTMATSRGSRPCEQTEADLVALIRRTQRFRGRSFLLAALAIVGVLGAIAFVMKGSTPPLVAQPVSAPTIAPYPSYVAGSGMLEASTRNIAISTPVGGVVTGVAVKVGDRVAKGQELFRIDGRDLEAQLAVKQSAAVVARAQIVEAQAVLDQ